jgi:hypothetical protein
MGILTRRSVLGASLALNAAETLPLPYIANAAAPGRGNLREYPNLQS